MAPTIIISLHVIIRILNTQTYKIIIYQKLTRKLSYRKDDRSMRPINGCPENFLESLNTPMATFSEIVNSICSDRSSEYAYKI